LRRLSVDAESELSARQPPKRVEPQVGEIHNQSPGYRLAEQIGRIGPDQRCVVPDDGADGMSAIAERLWQEIKREIGRYQNRRAVCPPLDAEAVRRRLQHRQTESHGLRARD